MYTTRYYARKDNPSAIIVKVEGGYIAFADWRSYAIWKGQK